MRTMLTALVGSSVLVGGVAVASADDEPAAPTKAPAASSDAPASSSFLARQTDQLVLPKGKIFLDAFLEVSLSKGDVGRPVSLAPDIWYGATNDLTVGLVHSKTATTGFLGSVGDGICFSGTNGNCPKPYNDVGVDVRYRLKTPFVFDGGLLLNHLSPLFLGLKVGAGARFTFLQNKLALEAMPSLYLGLTKRDDQVSGVVTTIGNRDAFGLPITVAYEVAPKVELSAQTGVQLTLEHAGDTVHVPLAIAGRYQVNPKLGVGLVLALPQLIAKTNGGVDVRTLSLGGSYAF